MPLQSIWKPVYVESLGKPLAVKSIWIFDAICDNELQPTKLFIVPALLI